MHKDVIKRYVNITIPVKSCNFRCAYCYITHQRLFEKGLPVLKYSPEIVRRGLSRKRMGGVCMINVCGEGETLLPPMVEEYIRVLLEEGHYLMVVTNGSVTRSMNRIARFDPDLLKRLFFKFSFHYDELKERNLLQKFYETVRMMRDAGCSFTIELTPTDEMVSRMDEIKQSAIDNVGACCHVTVARDERVSGELPILTQMDRKAYQQTWGKFKSELFDYKMEIFGIKRKEFCYAGDWSFVLDIGTGMMSQCYFSHKSQNILEDPDKPIRFLAVGNNCAMLHCHNGHGFLTFGNIPELKSPSMADVRNRVCKDGSEWLQPEMKSFMGTRLWQANKEYSSIRKIGVNLEVRARALRDTLKR